MFRAGQVVEAQVLAVDAEKRRIKLSIKQLVSTGLGEYLEEHKQGDVVSGRVVEQSPESAVIELGDGIRANCRLAAAAAPSAENKSSPAAAQSHCLRRLYSPSAAFFVGDARLDEAHNQAVLVAEKLHHLRGGGSGRPSNPLLSPTQLQMGKKEAADDACQRRGQNIMDDLGQQAL